MTKTWRNWRGDQQCHPQDIYYPQTGEEVGKIVREAGEKKRKVRVVGAGHSWTALVCTDDYLVSLDRLNQVVSEDRENCRLTVEAGIRLKDLNRELDRRGMALPNMGAVTEQSIAGATATGTHGTGLGFGNITSAVHSLELVTSSGEILSIEKGDDLYPAVPLSLGALGVVVTMTLQCVPPFGIHLKTRNEPRETLLPKLRQELEATDHLQTMILPYTGRMYVMAMERIETPPQPSLLSRGWQSLGAWANRKLSSMMMKVTNYLPSLSPTVFKMALGSEFKAREATGPSWKMLPFLDVAFTYTEMEYSIELDDVPNVVKDIEEMLEDRSLITNSPINLRFVQADDFWLSPSYQRDSCYVSMVMCSHGPLARRYREYFQRGEKILTQYRARPHWGKHFFVEEDYVKDLYPKFDDFARVRRELDPHRTFANPFIDRFFPE